MDTELATTRRDADYFDSAAKLGKLKQRSRRRRSLRVIAVTAATGAFLAVGAAATDPAFTNHRQDSSLFPSTNPAGGLAMSLGAVDAPATHAKDCNTTSWTWPFCDISVPSIPRISAGGRPDLTPKSSPWCRSDTIKASNSGYTYWILTQNTKYKIRFWPDYYSRYYQAVYWDGRAWQWLPVSSSYPHVIMGQRVNCDA